MRVQNVINQAFQTAARFAILLSCLVALLFGGQTGWFNQSTMAIAAEMKDYPRTAMHETGKEMQKQVEQGGYYSNRHSRRGGYYNQEIGLRKQAKHVVKSAQANFDQATGEIKGAVQEAKQDAKRTFGQAKDTVQNATEKAKASRAGAGMRTTIDATMDRVENGVDQGSGYYARPRVAR